MAGAAAITSLTAVAACGACCVLPLAIPAVVAGGAGGWVAWLAGAHTWITAVAVTVVLAAWAWVLRASVRTGLKPRRMTLALMGVATLALGMALLRPYIEPPIVSLLRH